MFQSLKDYFKFSSTEKRGVLFLSAIVVALMFTVWFRPFEVEQTLSNADQFNQQIAQFYQADSLREEEFKFRYQKNYPKKSYNKKYAAYEKKEYPKTEKPAIEPIDINLATAEDFDKLKGIGEYLSQKIIQYRTYLGGFYSVEQLKEIKGIKPEVIDENKKYLLVSKTELLRLDINTTDFKTLLKHPYLEYNDVKKIFRLRDSLKTISLKDVQKTFPDTLFTKVSPYLQ
jgi:competence ComEA-like helix-hairpin-helix protein